MYKRTNTLVSSLTSKAQDHSTVYLDLVVKCLLILSSFHYLILYFRQFVHSTQY